MATPAENLPSGSWASLEPYAQLVRSLLPRASGVAVCDAAAKLRWSSDAATWPELVQAVEHSVHDAAGDGSNAGQLRVLDGGVPLYLCWLRDDDSRQCLLEIPKWYFGWEAQYWFQRPIVLEPDDEIYVECHFDNSAKNQKNGQAPRDIGWGEENQEMCAGFLAFVEGAP
jgi:hypothetical protein